MHWLRLHHDTPNDPKWRLVAVESGQTVANVLAVWMHMMVNASQANPRGVLRDWSDRIVGAGIDLKGDAVAAIRQAMQGVVLDGDKLTGWENRQRASDNVAERVRKHREAKKAPPNSPGGGGNGGNGESTVNGQRYDTVPLQSGDVTLQNENVPLPPLTRETPESKKESDDDDDTRARAREVREEVCRIARLDPGKMDLARVQKWLDAGYDPEKEIYPAVKEAAPKAVGPIGHIQYFDKPIAERRAALLAPLPTVEAGNVHPIRPRYQGRPLDYGHARFLRRAREEQAKADREDPEPLYGEPF